MIRQISPWDQLRRPCPKLGEFVFYSGKIWIVVEEMHDEGRSSRLVDAEGRTALWHDSERSDGSYLEAWTPAKPPSCAEPSSARRNGGARNMAR